MSFLSLDYFDCIFVDDPGNSQLLLKDNVHHGENHSSESLEVDNEDN